MSKKSLIPAFVAFASVFSVSPVFAQNSVSVIDSEHSTARLYLASSKDPDNNVNVGVARATGVVKLNGGETGTPNFDFTIYPADKKSSQAGSDANKAPNYTVISFKCGRVVPLDANTFRVTGKLTTTYVEREVSYDPTEGYSGPTYGPSVTVSRTQEATFQFRRASSLGASQGTEWVASATIPGEDFPDLLNAVSSTDWPVFVADEHCTMPSNAGQEDYSGSTCTGERVDVAARKDLSCDTPSMVGEDFSGEVCTQIAPTVIAPDRKQAFSGELQATNSNRNLLIANEVQIQLDLLTGGIAPDTFADAGK
jgi:polyisoprenoid-binding protein YceI